MFRAVVLNLWVAKPLEWVAKDFLRKKRIFCYFSVNSNFLEAVVVPVVLPHYRSFFYFSLPYFSIMLLFGIK